MAGKSPFRDDWRDCLRAHYRYTVQASDRATEATLRVILRDAGFSDSDLAALTIAATAHVDDVAPDFVPDFVGLRAAIDRTIDADLIDDPPPPPLDTPLVEAEPALSALGGGQSADAEPEAFDEHLDEGEDDPDLPIQMSLF